MLEWREKRQDRTNYIIDLRGPSSKRRRASVQQLLALVTAREVSHQRRSTQSKIGYSVLESGNVRYQHPIPPQSRHRTYILPILTANSSVRTEKSYKSAPPRRHLPVIKETTTLGEVWNSDEGLRLLDSAELVRYMDSSSLLKLNIHCISVHYRKRSLILNDGCQEYTELSLRINTRGEAERVMSVDTDTRVSERAVIHLCPAEVL